MTTTFKSRNPATCKSNTQIQKISSPKFQQVCCWLALKIKPWWKKKKKKSLCTFISSSQSMSRLKWAWFHLSKEPKTPNLSLPTTEILRSLPNLIPKPTALELVAFVDYVTALRSTAKTSRDFNFQLRRERGEIAK